MSRVLSFVLRILAALVLATFALSVVPSAALAHIGGGEKPRFEGRKRPEQPREGPRGRAEVSLEGGGRLLRLASGDREMLGSFVLKNVGDGPLEVYGVGFDDEVGAPRAPSGIGISSPARESKPLAPGESRTYSVRWRWEETRATQLFGYLSVETDGAAPGASVYDAPVKVAVVADHRPGPLRNILTVVALFPLLVALFGALARNRVGERRVAQIGAGLAAAAALVACIPLVRFSRLLSREDGNWGLQHIERGHLFGDIEYFVGIDGTNAPLLPAVGVVLFAAAAASRPRASGSAFVLVAGGVIASATMFFLVSQSLALSTAALAVVAVAASVIAWRSVDRSSATARSAAIKTAVAFAIATLSFAVFAYLVSKNAFPSRLLDGAQTSRTWAIPEIAREAVHGHAAVDGAASLFGLRFERGILAFVLIAFGAFGAAAPLHGWASGLAGRAEASSAALVFGMTSLVSGHGLLSFSAALFPSATAWFAPVFFVVGLTTIVIGALGALVDEDLTSLVGRLSVASFGVVLLSLGALTPQGLQGHLAVVLVRALSLPLCLLVAGAIVQRTGESSIRRAGGITSAAPKLAVAWLVGVAAIAALPASAGFWPVLLSIFGAMGRAPWFALAFAGGLVLCAFAAARALRLTTAAAPAWWRESPHLEPHGGKIPDLRRDELPWVLVLVVLLVLLAVAPGYWLSLSDTTLLDLFRAIDPLGPTQVS